MLSQDTHDQLKSLFDSAHRQRSSATPVSDDDPIEFTSSQSRAVVAWMKGLKPVPLSTLPSYSKLPL